MDINYTIVNGQVTIEGQTCTGARPGVVLRSVARVPEFPLRRQTRQRRSLS